MLESGWYLRGKAASAAVDLNLPLRVDFCNDLEGLLFAIISTLGLILVLFCFVLFCFRREGRW